MIPKPFVDFVFIVYFDVLIEKKRSYKCFIQALCKEEAKSIFLKKINRDLRGFSISNIKTYKIYKKKYKGQVIPDKHWESIQNFCYPNSRHRLRKFNSKIWFRPIIYPNRNRNGQFISGNCPWNKGFKIQPIKRNKEGKFCKSRNHLGQFKKGVKPIVVGCNYK